MKAGWAPGDSTSCVSKSCNPEAFLANKKKTLDIAATFGGSARGKGRDVKFLDWGSICLVVG